MSCDRYQAADPVSANTDQPYNNKGVLVVGQGTAALYPRSADYSAGVTGQPAHGTSGGEIIIQGSSAGVVFPVTVFHVGAITTGTSVYRLH